MVQAETDLLANQVRTIDELINHRNMVRKHLDRATNIIREMLSLTKAGQGRSLDVDLNEVINSTLQFIMFNRVSLEKQMEPLPKIKGSPEELKQVFINLFENAIKAMPEGGRLIVKTYAKDGFATAEITDTGVGSRKRTLKNFRSIFQHEP